MTAIRTALFATVAATALLLAAPAIALPKPPAPAPAALSGLTMQMHVKIPMRDGSHLNATLYRPEGDLAPRPTIVMLTPYPGDTSHPSADYFARRGFNYAYVDVRGRGDSDGDFVPFERDAQDGYDMVEWLAKQPWANGQVAMFGGSYAGGDQGQVAGMLPPHLSAIAPVASVRPGIDFPMSNNMNYLYDEQWISLTSGHPFYGSVFTDGGLWNDIFTRMYRKGARFDSLDVEAGNPNATFKTWTKHPEFDAYWRGLSPTKQQIAKITIPKLVITGARDGDQQGTLSFYQDVVDNAGGKQPADYFLVIGPWDHPGTREPKPDIGDEHFGPASVIDVLRLHLEWYRHVLQDGPRPAFFEKNVAYYVSGPGAECWKFADSLAAVPSGSQTLYLNAANGGESLYHSGVLQDAQAGAAGGAWLSDPSDLRNGDHANLPPGEEIHGDGLIFHSAPFDKDTEIDGRVALNLALVIDGPDADVAYELYLITPDGKVHSLDQSTTRARYRTSLEHATLVTPGAVNDYKMTGQWFATRAPKGSRLRLVVHSLNDPGFEKNWNSPKPVAEQTMADAHKEQIRLVQSADHASTLTLPLGDPTATCKASAGW